MLLSNNRSNLIFIPSALLGILNLQQDVDISAGHKVLIERRLQPVKQRLSLYRSALKLIRSKWRQTSLISLRQEVSQRIPDAILFPVWDDIIKARNGKLSAAIVSKALDGAIRAIDEVLEGRHSAIPRRVIGSGAVLANEKSLLKDNLRIG
jgi:hypothetical protein